MKRAAADEAALGLHWFLSDAPGSLGRLRTEPEDFRVIELGPGPKPSEGKFTAARIELRNWETNRFVHKASRELKMKPNGIAFAGMKDKRAVTEQWFTFRCDPERVRDLERLDDVRILGEPYTTHKGTYTGAHEGNRFVLRIRDGIPISQEDLDAGVDAIRSQGGVPNYFGPQRFGSGVRPVTAAMGKAIVEGDLEEAVRLYCGHPLDGEQDDIRAARAHYEEHRDPAAALEIYPDRFDHEKAILRRLVEQPENYRQALRALPQNLLRLFLHAYQSLAFNEIVSARLEAGWGLREARVGDLVIRTGDDGTSSVPVTETNQERVQAELDKNRAWITAPLPGYSNEFAKGDVGAMEHDVMERMGMDPQAFRASEFPQLASPGRRRGILQPVTNLDAKLVEGDPVLSFELGKGAYATVVLREFMQAPLLHY